MKILLAIDGSRHTETVVEEIANRCFTPGTEVRIVTAYKEEVNSHTINAVGTLNLAMPMSSFREYETTGTALNAAENNAGQAARILSEKNPALTITTNVIEGSAKRVILEEAENFQADLIVVGSHGYGAVERLLLGSVSQAVALHAKCSVEIVRKKQ